ncbi:MAG: class I SAM-dependent methyltransferase [bacterium]|nr:class I SAM-dependent methyltransferase [bacterium]
MSLKSTIKRFLPRGIHLTYNRLVSRRVIQRKLGNWFDVDWKQKAAAADDSHWIETYNRSWEKWNCQDLTDEDLTRIKRGLSNCKKILDVGCGDGYLLSQLQDRANQAYGVDISIKALLRTRVKIGESVNLFQAFADKLPFKDNSFDGVVSAHTLEHVKSLPEAVAELKRVCSGRLIILVPVQEEFLPYSEDYHLHSFKNESDLMNAIGILGAKCERYRVAPGETLFSGDVLLLTADI